MKICKKCEQEKSLDNFCNRKGEKDGKHRYCKSCLNGDFSEYYHTSGRKDSPYYKQYREENKEYFRKYCSTHYHSTKDIYREWNNMKYHSDFGFRLKHTVASRIWHALKTYGPTWQLLTQATESQNKSRPTIGRHKLPLRWIP